MRAPLSSLRVALPLALFLAGAGLVIPAPLARAEDGPVGPEGSEDDEEKAEDLEAEIKAQMDKILRLLRDNEKALLEASVAGGRRPEGVAVEPPPGSSESAAMSEPPPAGTPPAGTPPQGEEVRRRIEELVRSTQQQGGTIPGELENLVKMIPT